MSVIESSDKKFLITIHSPSESSKLQVIEFKAENSVSFYDFASTIYIDCFCKSGTLITAENVLCKLETPTYNKEFTIKKCETIDETLSIVSDHIIL